MTRADLLTNRGRGFRALVCSCLVLVLVLALQASAGSGAGHLSPVALKHGLLCIHSHEGSWRDRGAPYYGGLQMDARFERSWGHEFVRMWGHANRWPAAVQLVVAMRAYFHRGFDPWPNTARACGLR